MSEHGDTAIAAWALLMVGLALAVAYAKWGWRER